MRVWIRNKYRVKKLFDLLLNLWGLSVIIKIGV